MQDLESIKQEIGVAKNLAEVDGIYRKYLGKKGEIVLALREIGKLEASERKKVAPQLQELKRAVDIALTKKAQELKHKKIEDSLKAEWIDVSAPGRKAEKGYLHPLTVVQSKVNEIFSSLGFEIVEGPEIEDEWHNFDALNIPKDHPARDLWDTFWLKRQITNTKLQTNSNNQNTKLQKLLLRTHTSPVQIRYMEQNQPPFRIVVPGRVFRHEASDASHDIQFYQLEGLMVDKDISVANFKAVMNEFLNSLFGKEIKIRLRPSYFPFTEPSFEVDMRCLNCNGKGFIASEQGESKGCSVCSRGGWLEMLGAGMVHPNVFKSAGFARSEAEGWQGFAFGIGLDRIAMMKYKIDDIRLFYSGDLRFLKQF